MASKAQCRFCLEPTETPENPFLQPCDCRGSIKNVHLECLLKWRNTTNEYQNRLCCQLCNTKYLMPTRWPIQPLPTNSVLYFCMKRFYLMSVLMHIAHVSVVNNTKYEILFLSNRGVLSFHSLLIGVTMMYIFYIRNLITQLTARKLYCQYLAFGKTMYPNYRMTLFLMTIVYSLTISNPFIFGYAYLYLLTKLIYAHNNVITQMNNDAEYRILE